MHQACNDSVEVFICQGIVPIFQIEQKVGLCIGRSRAVTYANEIVDKPVCNHEDHHSADSQYNHSDQKTTPPASPWFLWARDPLYGGWSVQARHARRALGNSALLPTAVERVF